jgi:argininosuccinate synthase
MVTFMRNTTTSIKKVVLAYSGGLDTSVAIHWLKATYRCEVIAFCADLGQGEELRTIKKKALAAGANNVYVEDLREIFARDYLFPMLRANAVYEGSYLLGTSIARPLIARRQVEIAKKERADAVAHGATGKGNDQVRFELTYLAMEPALRIIAPWREWKFRSRSDLMDYAKRHSIPIQTTRKKPYSIDRNLFHVSYEGGILEDPWLEPPDKMFQMTASPKNAPDQPENVEIGFKEGNPVTVNRKNFSPAALIDRLNQLGGAHGIGRVDLVENRYIGMKSRGVYETPGGTLLHTAHRAVESITMDREVMHLRDSWVPQYSELVYNGYWFSPEREMLQQAVDSAQASVEGMARLRLYKGSATVIGRKSKRSIYNPKLATFEAEEVFDPQEASGFIRLNALRLQQQALHRKKKG